MTNASSVPRRLRQLAGLAGWVLLCFAAPALGAWSPPGEWYARLNKPSWTPPNWLFGPVWTMLYLMMAVSAWRIWRSGGFNGARRELGWFLVQLALNAAWTPVFFGLRQPGWALIVMLALWGAIATTLVAFLARDRLAGLLLAPYLAWVSFAAILNFTLWRLN